jgi:hypothetical protein
MGKSKKVLEKKKARRAAKDQKRSLYQSQSMSGKVKRGRRQKSVRLVKDRDHPNGRCGNIGCKKCWSAGDP